MNDDSLEKPTSTRQTRSNTDLTKEKSPQVLRHRVEKKKKDKKKEDKNKSSVSLPENLGDLTLEEIESVISTADPPLENPFPDPKVEDIWKTFEVNQDIKEYWEKFEFELVVTEDFFYTSSYILYPPKVYRPIMADSKQDIEDDRTTLTERVTEIQTTLDNHAAPAAAVPMTLDLIELNLEDLQSIKIVFDKIRERTRRVFRGSPQAELDAAMLLNNNLFTAWKNATMQAHTIKTEVQSQVVSRVKIPKAEPPSFDGNSTNWPAFLDQFNSMVVKNNQVSATDKLTLLKKSLEKGTAYHLVQNFPLTDIDWTNAWTAVKSRYSHERELINAHISKLFELISLTYQNQLGIRKIVDTVNEVIRALNNLEVVTDNWDPILIYIIKKNLDTRTKTDFEKSLPDDKKHSLQVLTDYLNVLAAALGAAGIVDKPQRQNKHWISKDSKETKDDKSTKSENASSSQGQATTEKTTKKIICIFCEKSHWNSKCPTLIPLTPQQRSKLAGEKKLCKNCLMRATEGHKTDSCKANPCGVNGCKSRHHSLLHIEPKVEANSAEVQNKKSNDNVSSCLSVSEHTGLDCLLSTAYVNIIAQNETHKVRVLVDCASQVNLITEKLANKLNLKWINSKLSINGIGNSKPNFAKGRTSVQIQSTIDKKWKTHRNCYILPQVTGQKPSQVYDTSALEHFKNLKLADETFNIPGPVDMVLGAQFFLDILGTHHVKGNPSALDTKLGYIVMGEYYSVDPEIPAEVSTLTCDVNFDLSRFWMQEEVPQNMKLSPEEQEAENKFTETCKQDISGKFTVALPFKSETSPLGESRFQAKKRLEQIERKLNRYPDKKILYHKAMNDYIQEGYVVKVPDAEITKPISECFYLPHHFVEKESTTTKFRVVFDGSAKTSFGPSLNDNLLVGPCIQNDLVKILLRFREHPIVFSADIRKMYLQIGIQEEDQDFLRFLWRDSPQDPIKDYRYTVVPFGLSSSPFLAIRSLHHLANTQKEKYPVGSEALINDFYVDDCLSGASDVKSALEKQRQLRRLLKSGQFDLIKFSSNHPELLESIPIEERETQLPLEIESTNQIKTLGILWNPASDNFTFKIKLPKESVFTKRQVASYAAKIYDPTGLVQPVIILAKQILQDLWESRIGWDENIPENIQTNWKEYLTDLPNLEKLQIPRHVMPNNPEKLILHGFCDASKKAYGTAIYVVGIRDGTVISSHLLSSKSKVAPLRMVTMPRLELMGAVMLTKHMKSVLKTCRNSFDEVHYWSDSSIVLNQINKPSRRFKTFVGNRISYIQENTEQSAWHYVKSSENPADLVSRGVKPSDLIHNKLWWNGREWLQSFPVCIPPIPKGPANQDLEEISLQPSS